MIFFVFLAFILCLIYEYVCNEHAADGGGGGGLDFAPIASQLK